MEQRLGLDVCVEKGGGTSQLGQAEPHRDEVGFVVHEEHHAVPLLQGPLLQEHVGHPVAALINVSVRVYHPLVNKESFVRDTLRLFHERVHHSHHPGGQFAELQFDAVRDDLPQKGDILPEVGEKQLLQHVQGEKPRGHSWEPLLDGTHDDDLLEMLEGK